MASKEALDIFRVVAIYGARQCGKTTLAKQLAVPGSDMNPGGDYGTEY